ncbi:MAG TPA: FG-GAP-like repeat-containing protein, partial [Solirubrobacteraceae bacterium]
GETIASLAAGRIDGDTRLDLVATRSADDAGVLLQQGDGTLGPQAKVYVGEGSTPPPTSAALGDLTADGLADLSVGGDQLVVARQPSAAFPRPDWLRDATPADGASGVATGAALTLRLNRDLDASTVKAASVRLARGDTGAAVATTPSYDPGTRTLTVQPSAALATGAPYALALPGIRDTRGAAPPSSPILRFRAAGATDTTPPDTGFSSGAVGTISGSYAWFATYASEPGTRTQCSLDGAPFADCEPELNSGDTALTAGAHTFRVRAVDAAGNVDATPASRVFSRRTGSPPAHSSSTSPKALTGSTGSITDSSAGADWGWGNWDEHADSLQLTGESAGGSPVFYAWTAPANGTVTFDTAGSAFDTVLGAFTLITDPNYYRRLASNDDASPTAASSRVSFPVRTGKRYLIGLDGFGDGLYAPNGAIRLAWSFTAGTDTTPPETTIDAGPASRTDRSGSLDFHASEPDSSFECREERDGQVETDWHLCQSPARSISEVGVVKVAVRATDTAGNVDPTPAEWSWEMPPLPATSLDDGPDWTTTSRSATFRFTGSATAARFECRLDRAPWAACTSPRTVTGLADGPHDFYVRAVDEFGRADPSGGLAWEWTVLPDSVDAAVAGTSAGGARAVRADFNGDGRSDLAVGIPGEDVAGVRDAGGVQILMGSANGLTATGGRLWTRGDPDVAGVVTAGDAFGASLAAGDFDGDGRADLAIGAPGQDTSGFAGSGAVHVLYGSASGLAGARAQQWSQASADVADAPERGDAFGAALAAGDADGDGRDDLAVGAPAEGGGALAEAGAVHLLRGAATTGLSGAGSQLWSQASTGVADDAEAGDAFGAALAFGRLDGDGRAELAVGVPGEDAGAVRDAGAVHVLPGATAGVTATASRLLTQDTTSVADTAEPYDRFGTTLAAGALDGAAGDDLVVGVPEEDLGALRDAGAVHVLSGGLAAGSSLLTQDTADVAEAAEAGDRFGAALAAADLGGTAAAELVVGAPFEDLGAVADAGAVHVLPGGTAAGSSLWTQDSTGVAETAEAGDRFGAALTAGDYGGTAHGDLAVAVPGESVGTVRGAGAVNVLAGAAGGVTAGAGALWSQASAGVPDAPEAGDGFGAGLGR